MNNTVLVVAAHPDDEVLGCGGTIAKHSKNGDRVKVLILGDGESSRGTNEGITHRKETAIKASSILGANEPAFMDMPDNKMDQLALLEVVKCIEEYIKEFSPNIVYTHHNGDLNIDHQITNKAVMTACRPIPESKIKAIFSFETLSSTEWNIRGNGDIFTPNYFVDISETMDLKKKALKCYDKEMRPFPHARSYEAITHLAKLRGAQNGLVAAEAFVIQKYFWR